MFESSTANGFRNISRIQICIQEIKEKTPELEKDIIALQKQVFFTHTKTTYIFQAFKKVDLKSKIQMVEKRMKVEQIENENLHTEEVSFLKRTNLQLKRQIEEITSTNRCT